MATQIDLLHVPYKGESEGIQAMLSGQVALPRCKQARPIGEVGEAAQEGKGS